MSLLCPTPPERMVDAQGRPYFLWDSEMTLRRFEELLRTGDEATRAYLIGKLMRQARPDDHPGSDGVVDPSLVARQPLSHLVLELRR